MRNAPAGTSHGPRWQPFTFGGVASLAQAPFGHFALIVSLGALLCGVAIAFFFFHSWKPALARALSQLPDQGEIRAGTLHWSEPGASVLVSSAFVSIVVDPERVGGFGETADVQCEFHRNAVRVRSLFGYLTVSYPENRRIAFNRAELEPWWGAWLPAIGAGLIAGAVIWLWLIWSMLGLIYSVPVAVIAFFADRKANFRLRWQLGMAACLPGAVVMSCGILAYALYQIQLVHLLFVAAAHIILGWIYVLFAPLCLPRLGNADRLLRPQNPFREPNARS